MLARNRVHKKLRIFLTGGVYTPYSPCMSTPVGGHKNGACKDELIRIPGLSDRSVKVDCTRPPAGLGILQEVEALNVSAVDSIHWL